MWLCWEYFFPAPSSLYIFFLHFFCLLCTPIESSLFLTICLYPSDIFICLSCWAVFSVFFPLLCAHQLEIISRGEKEKKLTTVETTPSNNAKRFWWKSANPAFCHSSHHYICHQMVEFSSCIGVFSLQERDRRGHVGKFWGKYHPNTCNISVVPLHQRKPMSKRKTFLFMGTRGWICALDGGSSDRRRVILLSQKNRLCLHQWVEGPAKKMAKKSSRGGKNLEKDFFCVTKMYNDVFAIVFQDEATFAYTVQILLWRIKSYYTFWKSLPKKMYNFYFRLFKETGNYTNFSLNLNFLII